MSRKNISQPVFVVTLLTASFVFFSTSIQAQSQLSMNVRGKPALQKSGMNVNSAPAEDLTGLTDPLEPTTKQEQRKAKFESLQEQWQERTTLREERKKTLSEMQAQRLEMVKKHATLSEARMRKALEHLSAILEKVDAFLEEQKSQGFDTTAQEAQLAELQTQLTAIETKIDAFSAAYASLDQLPDTQLGPQIAEVKKQARSIVADLVKIRVQIKSIVRASR